MENKDIISEIIFDKETLPKSRRSKKEEYKEKECKVIRYNRITKTLDIKFDKFGIRIRDINLTTETSTITVKYKGEIGKPNFVLKV